MTRSRREQEISDLDSIHIAIEELAKLRRRAPYDGANWIVKDALEAYDRISQRLRDSVPLGPLDAR